MIDTFLVCAANAAAARESLRNAEPGFSKVAATHEGLLLPMPPANVLAGISTEEALASACNMPNLHATEDMLNASARREPDLPPSPGREQNAEATIGLPVPPKYSLSSELPLMVCPNSFSFSFCEVEKLS